MAGPGEFITIMGPTGPIQVPGDLLAGAPVEPDPFAAQIAPAPAAPPSRADLEAPDFQAAPSRPEAAVAAVLSRAPDPTAIPGVPSPVEQAGVPSPTADLDRLAEERRAPAARQPQAFTERIEDAGQAQAAAVQRQGELEAQRLTRIGEGTQAALEENRRLLAQEDEARKAFETDFQETLKSLRARNEEISNTPIDPRRAFKQASTGRKIAGAIGVALRGLVAPFQGGRNPALDIIMQAVDQDIRAQEASLANQRAGIGAEMNLLGLERQLFGDMQTAKAATRIDLLNTALQMVQAEATGLEGEKAKAEAARLAAALQGEIASTIEKAALDRANLALDERRTRLAERQVNLGFANLRQRQAGRGDDAKKLEQLANQAVPTLIDPRTGQPFIATSKETATKLKDSIAQFMAFNSNLDRLLQLREKVGFEFFSGGGGLVIPDELFESEEAKRGKALAAVLRLDLKELGNLGVLSGSDIEFLNRQIPEDPFGLRDPTGQLLEVRNSLARKLDEKLRAEGYPGSATEALSRDLGLDPEGVSRGRRLPQGLPPLTEEETAVSFTPTGRVQTQPIDILGGLGGRR